MFRLISTLVVAVKCMYCGKYLKQTEAYYLGNECTDCNYHHSQEKYNKSIFYK